jgi:hypothetical protein
VVYFISGEDSTSVLCGFTIAQGSGTIGTWYDPWSGEFTYKAGGGVFIDSSGAKIKYNYIMNNLITGFGNCAGGGLLGWYILEDKALVIENNIIVNNIIHASTKSGGGGISVYEVTGFCQIKKNSISYNSVTVESDYKAVAGGIDCEFYLPATGKVVITENIVSYNELHCEYSYGAGMYFVHWGIPEPIHDHDPTPLVYNNIISNNYSQDAGAGVAIWLAHLGEPEYLDMSPQPALINNTIVNNKSSRGSGIYCWNASFLLMNNILWNNIPSTTGSEIDMGEGGASWDAHPNDHNKIYSYNTIISDGFGNDFNDKVFATDPLFADTLYHLSQNSPCIGMGRKSIYLDGATYQAPEYDLDGNSRPNPIDTLIDIGAFESEYEPFLKVYPHSLEIDKLYAKPESDPIQFTAHIDNPDFHTLNVFGRITSLDGSVVDSVELFDDGSHGDGQAGDGLYSGTMDPVTEEHTFHLSVGVKDNDNGSYLVFNDHKRITSIGPVVFDSYKITNKIGNIFNLKISLKNEGSIATASGITAEVTTTDPNIMEIKIVDKNPTDISAGQKVEILQNFTIKITGSPDTLYFKVKIYSNGYHFWTDSSAAPNFIKPMDQKIPNKFSMSQNYPNPFNPKTIINYELPIMNYVDISIYNVLGQKVATLVDRKQKAGFYTVEWDASGMASGIYYYRLVAGEYMNTKKLVFLR